jgi:predicted Zn-dependent protease
MKPRVTVLWLALPLLAWLTATPQVQAAPEHILIELMTEELDHSFKNLAMPDGTKPYYIGYTITDMERVSVGATLGALTSDNASHQRQLDVDIRVGDYSVDSTHKIRGGGYDFDPSDFFGGATDISIEDDPAAIKHAIWLATDRTMKSAARKHQRVQTNLKTMVEEEDKSDDFSREDPVVHAEPEVKLSLDRKAWADRIRRVAGLARRYPLIYTSSVSLIGSAQNRYMVTSEGTRLQAGRKLLRVVVSAGTKAEDGMDLSQSFLFNACSEAKLPSEEQLTKKFQAVIDQVLALREAPLVEPYEGPAILLNRASGVFFHEIFGHRIEGHRQKDVDEGQTFAKKVGELVLPEFISVRDDPTMAVFGEEDLRGHYKYDDEGVESSNVRLIEKGILKTFLMSRSPVKDFPKSNGHGRRQPGRKVVSRQGNLIVESDKAVSPERLREILGEQCREQGKEYGFLFEDITGGFTSTGRRGPQVFKVLPVVVYRIYADGRPDELVRGVDIVGTPLASFSKIIYTGDDPAVFNGTCGAESGMVPVSAISPSILVSQIEIEKRRRAQDKPPILPAPIAEEQKTPKNQQVKK